MAIWSRFDIGNATIKHYSYWYQTKETLRDKLRNERHGHGLDVVKCKQAAPTPPLMIAHEAHESSVFTVRLSSPLYIDPTLTSKAPPTPSALGRRCTDIPEARGIRIRASAVLAVERGDCGNINHRVSYIGTV